MTYQIAFYGRKRGALGIRYRIVVSVEAPSEEIARLKLYDDYEHISVIEVTI